MHESRIEVSVRLDIPLREVSGLAVSRDGDGVVVLAVGDHGPDVSVARVDVDGGIGSWESFDLGTLADAPASHPAQAEAIAVDGDGTLLVLVEDPPQVLVVDRHAGRWRGVLDLDASGVPEIAVAWADDPASRGEGLVLLQGGHLLVVKEKHPAGLLEFAPHGESARGVSASTMLPADQPWIAPAGVTPGTPVSLHAVAWWPVPDVLDDVSELAVRSDGRLFLLSDKSNAIARLGDDLDPAGGEAVLDALWRLPAGVRKAEGLAFLPDGRALVAVDRHGRGRNLAVLPPPTLTPS